MNDIVMGGGDDDDRDLDAIERLNRQMATAATAIQGLVESMRIGRAEVRALAVRVDRIEAEADTSGRHWSLAVWCRVHGRSASRELLAKEGRRVRIICEDHGFAVEELFSSNGAEFPGRQWPVEAVEIWWPDFCRRQGWPVVWKVKRGLRHDH